MHVLHYIKYLHIQVTCASLSALPPISSQFRLSSPSLLGTNSLRPFLLEPFFVLPGFYKVVYKGCKNKALVLVIRENITDIMPYKCAKYIGL